MSFDVLFGPFEAIDAWLAGLLAGAPLVLALGIAFVLGLRHAADSDHLVAVTSCWPARTATSAPRPGSGPVGGSATPASCSPSGCR